MSAGDKMRAMDSDLRVGDRVALHPSTDLWMQGDRFGEVVKVVQKKVYVLMEKSGKRVPFVPSMLNRVERDQ